SQRRTPPAPRPPTKVGAHSVGSRRSTLTPASPRCQDGAMTTTGSATAAPAGLDREAVITGAAVLLDLRTAPSAALMLAALIDGALQLGVLVLGTLAVAVAAARADLDDGLVAAAIVTVSVLAYVGYPVLSELLLRGRSVGRLALGTRVVRGDGGPVHV